MLALDKDEDCSTMGTIHPFPSKLSPHINPAEIHESAEKDYKPHLMLYIAATFVVLVSAAFNISGFAFLGYELAGFLITGAVVFGLIGAVLNVGKIVLYLTNGSFVIKLIVHSLGVAFSVVAAMHLMNYSVQTTQDKNTQLVIAKEQLSELNAKIDLFKKNKNELAELNKQLIAIKNKPVKKDTVWTDSQQCTNQKHPRDCTLIQQLLIDKAQLESANQGVDILVLTQKQAEIQSLHPETRVKQEDFQVSRSIVDQLHALILPSIPLSYWILSVSFMISAIIELVEYLVMSPFGGAKNAENGKTSKNKDETRMIANLKQALNKLFSLPAKLAEARAQAQGVKRAELEHELKKQAELEQSIAKNAPLNAKAYLSIVSTTQIKLLIDKKGLSDNIEAKKKTILFIYWMLKEYQADEFVKIDEIESLLKIKYDQEAAFIKRPFVYAQIRQMFQFGFLINAGTAQRAKYKWASEADILQLFR